ncbi:MAG: hypothetical protein BGO95_03220 [Micrococcales bacterium 73-13]|nr:MAG: hypothetical protein BGO95_03220 [Micrococcales bacterium 73-13]
MLDRMLVVLSEPVPGREDEYNEWYDAIHLPEALTIPGFRGARRFRTAVSSEDPGPALGASYLTIYDLDVDTEIAARNLMEARQNGRLSPLSPALATETIVRAWFNPVGEWARVAEEAPRA